MRAQTLQRQRPAASGEETPDRPGRGLSTAPPEPIVACSGLVKRYDHGPAALNNVSFTMGTAQFVVLLGASGSGKTTLLRTLAGLVLPDEGRIEIGGTVLTSASRSHVRRQLGMIHQEFGLVERLTAAQNVLAGAAATIAGHRILFQAYPRALRQKACALLAEVGLTEIQANRKARELSGGQRQRVGIARALIGEPRLLLADEPVANLDPQTAAGILGLIRHAVTAHGVGALCSLHQISLACQYADRIIGLKAGQLVFDGPPSALTPEAAAELFEPGASTPGTVPGGG